VLDRRPQATTAAEGPAEQINPLQAEVLRHEREVIAERLVAERSVDVPGVSVALQLDRDDPSLLGQLIDDET
jgi:hypothetical protein